MKENLRPCVVNIPELTERYRTNIDDEIHTGIIRKAEIHRAYFHRAYFHKWVEDGASSGCESIMKSYGIVEYEDGTIP